MSETFVRMAGWNLSATYAAFAALSLLFVARQVRETRGRALEQMG